MQDYLSAIDWAADSLPYVDRNRLGAVGASFGGFSVYYLAGIHEKRFKAFIAHDGAFNLAAMYLETEENWFSNWEYDDAYWNRDPERRSRRLGELFALDPQLEFAHAALMEFYDVAEATEFADKRSGLAAWLDKYVACDCPPIRQAAYSIHKHRRGLENSWKYHKSNGVTESLNQKTKNIVRASFGIRSFERLRKRILLASGATTLDLKSPYTIFGEKRGPAPKRAGADAD